MMTFRTLTLIDAPKLLQIYSDKESMKYRGSQPMETIEEAKNFVRNQKIKKDETLTIRKAVVLERAEELIGTVMFRFREEESEVCEIGYSIGRPYWGQGYGKAIVKEMIETVSKNNAIKEMIAWSHQDNLASIKILKNLGFKSIEHQKDNKLLLFKLNLI